MSDDLIFYTNPASRGRVARWMLEEVAAPYRTVQLDFNGTMKSPDYLAINPLGKVPAILHRSKVITENAAICAYLADTFPGAGLVPAAHDRADYYRWLFIAAGPFEQAMTYASLGHDYPEDMRRSIGFASLPEMLDLMEEAVTAHPFIAGDTFSAADVFVASLLGWGMFSGNFEKRDTFTAYVGRCMDRPACRRAQSLDEQ